MNNSVSLEQLHRRVVRLQWLVTLLAICCLGLATLLWLFESRGNVRAAAPESLTVKRLAVVDDNGRERVVIAAPLPDPVVNGQRVKRTGIISGIAILTAGAMNAEAMQPQARWRHADHLFSAKNRVGSELQDNLQESQRRP